MPSLPRSVWDEPRPAHAPVRVWRDWVLVGVLIPVAVIEGILRPDLPARTLAVAVAVALVPALLWRRTRPLLMVAITFAVCGLFPLVGGGDLELNTFAYVLLLPYALYRWGSGREAVIGSAIMAAKIGLSAAFGYLSGADTLLAFVVLSAAFGLGMAFRYRARARAREHDQIKLLERERLARDLHDTVAHHVSAMAIRAQAGLATAAANPDAATDALRIIEAEASQALTEMRAMVRVLRRAEPVELAPTPGLSDLDGLAGRFRAGPAVSVSIVGDVDHLPPTVGTAIYRLAQESVTNAQRHARHATRIEVRVMVDDSTVRLSVSDDGDTSAIRPTASPGFGLVGMMERAGLLGGTCHAGPHPDRGWTVTAELPRAGFAT